MEEFTKVSIRQYDIFGNLQLVNCKCPANLETPNCATCQFFEGPINCPDVIFSYMVLEAKCSYK